MHEKKVLFNSDTNIIGGVPDYAVMIEYINQSLGSSKNADFSFRTENAGRRFMAAIGRAFLSFENKAHKEIFKEAMVSQELRVEQKFLVLFWQMTINNLLFSKISENYFMKCVLAGRLSLRPEEIMSYFYELRNEYPGELQWSDATLKLTASKYLTILKKLGLAEGSQTKELRFPTIGDEIFITLVRLALSVYPDNPTETNILFKFSFLDTPTLISRLKAIKYTQIWNLKQLGNNVKIELL